MSTDTSDDNSRRRFVPTDEVVAQFKGAPHVDAQQLRDDLDRIATNETPSDETNEE